MGKNLKIEGKNIKVNRGTKGFNINEKALEEVICEKLPDDMEHYKDYFANIEISIEIQENGELITVTNYTEEDK